jgi:hypothetical protein
MKKILFLVIVLALSLMTTEEGLAQSRQQKRQLRLIDKEIFSLKKEKNNSEKNSRIDSLKVVRERILDNILSPVIPAEMFYREVRLRHNGYEVKSMERSSERQEMVLNKIKGNISSNVESSKTILASEKTQGYEGIARNDDYRTVVFRIFPLNGGEKIDVIVDPGKSSVFKLIPGSYEVRYFERGYEACNPSTLTIDGQLKLVSGVNYFFYIIKPAP